MIFINIGSNLNSPYGKRIDNIKKAIELIKYEKIDIVKKSSIYETPSYPNNKNPKFLNICLSIKSSYSPLILLKIFKKIEKKMLRGQSIKNAPRICDIDIIDYNNKVFNTQKLSLPHPRAHLRNFVLLPLSEISPSWKHPVLNIKIDFLINKLNVKLRNEITRLRESVTINQ